MNAHKTWTRSLTCLCLLLSFHQPDNISKQTLSNCDKSGLSLKVAAQYEVHRMHNIEIIIQPVLHHEVMPKWKFLNLNVTPEQMSCWHNMHQKPKVHSQCIKLKSKPWTKAGNQISTLEFSIPDVGEFKL